MTEKTTSTTTKKKFFVLTEVLLICPQLTAKKKKKGWQGHLWNPGQGGKSNCPNLGILQRLHWSIVLFLMYFNVAHFYYFQTFFLIKAQI